MSEGSESVNRREAKPSNRPEGQIDDQFEGRQSAPTQAGSAGASKRECSFDYLRIEEEDGVCIITLDRPEARNAINSAMWAELCDAFEHFDEDDSLQVAILTNTGKVFCAGADLKEYNEKTLHPPKGRETWGTGAMTRKLWRKPIIMAANGKVVGGGAEMLLASDIAVLSDDGLVSFPEAKSGLFPGNGGAPLRIGRSIHLKHAMELLLTGAPIDACTAVQWGLANRAVPEDQLMKTAMGIAQQIMANGPLAVRLIKQAVYGCMDKSFVAESDGWQMMDVFQQLAADSEDAQEGTAAFREKRSPQWKGR